MQKMFKKGTERVEDEPCSGRTFTSTEERSTQRDDHLVTPREDNKHFLISFGYSQAILSSFELASLVFQDI